MIMGEGATIVPGLQHPLSLSLELRDHCMTQWADLSVQCCPSAGEEATPWILGRLSPACCRSP